MKRLQTATLDQKITAIITALIILLTPLLVYTSGFFEPTDQDFQFPTARVLEVNEEVLQEDPLIAGRFLGTQQIKVEILEGPFAGEKYNLKNTLSRIYNVKAKEGMTVILRLYVPEGSIKDVSVENYKRDSILYILGGFFFLVLLGVGGIKGFKSALALYFTGIMLLFFMLPLLFKGYEAIPVSILTVSITAIIALLLISGINRKTLSAIIGTVSGVLMAGVISFAAGKAAHLSGVSTAEASELISVAMKVGMKIDGLMFAAILIASLGAVMDIAMSISASIFEIHEANPDQSAKDLMMAGIRIGRDVIGTMSNTLILAFVGSSLNILILIVAYQMSYNQIMNLDIVGIELIQALAGSVGIVLTVPITATLAATLCKKDHRDRTKKQAA